MKKSVYFIVLCSIFFLSCKNDQKKSATQKKTELEVKKELVIKISFKTNKEDVFKLTLNNIVVDELQKKSIQVYETVPPSSNFESINAAFGAENFSNTILFSLGNKKKKEIVFNTIEFTYGGNSKLITETNFSKFLKVNKFVDINEDSFGIKTKFVDGKHNPIISAKKALIDFLKK